MRHWKRARHFLFHKKRTDTRRMYCGTASHTKNMLSICFISLAVQGDNKRFHTEINPVYLSHSLLPPPPSLSLSLSGPLSSHWSIRHQQNIASQPGLGQASSSHTRSSPSPIIRPSLSYSMRLMVCPDSLSSCQCIKNS